MPSNEKFSSPFLKIAHQAKRNIIEADLKKTAAPFLDILDAMHEAAVRLNAPFTPVFDFTDENMTVTLPCPDKPGNKLAVITINLANEISGVFNEISGVFEDDDFEIQVFGDEVYSCLDAAVERNSPELFRIIQKSFSPSPPDEKKVVGKAALPSELTSFFQDIATHFREEPRITLIDENVLVAAIRQVAQPVLEEIDKDINANNGRRGFPAPRTP